MKFLLLLISPFLLASIAVSNPDESTVTEKKQTTKPLVKKLENGSYQIGKIVFNKTDRTITFPARVNITAADTLIEYLIVHLNGEKTHEALLTTEVDPTNINIALKLLNYKESLELFRLLDEDGALSDNYYQVPEDVKKAARFSIHVTWKDKGVIKNRPITQWLSHTGNQKSMPETPWIYNGSYVHDKKFKSKLTGSIITIQPDPGAIANYSGTDRDDDELWSPAANLPNERSEVTVIFKPWK